MQYEITTALGSETPEADLKAANQRFHELDAKLITKNDQVMNLTQENKGLRHSLGSMQEKC